MIHHLPPLPFATDALEPWMSAETLEYHYGKHHLGYIDKLNELVQGTEFENATIEQIIRRWQNLQHSELGPIFNNAAQAWNHTFFWQCLSGERPTQRAQVGGTMRALLERDFGTVATFEEEFKKASIARFGSGWAWLVQSEPNGKLSIETTSNADTPLRTDRKPILTCDLWEHAYYIDYRHERTEFVDAYFQLVNWEFAERNLFSSKSIAA